jgi:hypothetical integral membrane protein (TIGR02206 family)
MNTFFSRIPLDGVKEFELRSLAHVMALTFALLLIGLSYYYLPRLKGKRYEPFVRLSIIGYLVLSSLYKQWFFVSSDVPWYMYVPEATCGFAILTATITLLTRNRLSFVLTFFWGWGAFTALFAPSILEGPSYYYFYQYYLRHALIVIASLYMIRVFDFKILKRDFLTYFYVTLTMALIGLIASLVINDPNQFNMFYMLQPAVNNPFLDRIWTFSHLLYVIFWIGVATLFGYIYGLPFYSRDTKSPKREMIDSK